MMHEEERRDCEESYYMFVRHAWDVLEPQTEFADNWHIRYLCDLLQKEVERIAAKQPKTHDIVINVPPRSMKSYLVTIFLAPWAWTRFPHLRFINVSYEEGLAIDLCMKSRRLIESQWYQSLWSDKFKLTSDQNTKKYYDNDKGGFRRGCPINSITGFGCDVLAYDDPQNPKKAESDIERENTKQAYGQTGYSRLNDQSIGLRLVIQQRLHECLLPGTMVRTPNGNKAIEKIRVDDVVLGRCGWQNVDAVGTRDYNGDVCGIKLWGYPQETWTTDNHLYLTRRGWVRADELTIRDWVATPTPKGKDYIPEWEPIRKKRYESGLGCFNGKRGTKVSKIRLQELVDKKMSNVYIAKSLEVNRSTVQCAMYYYGIEKPIERNVIADEGVVSTPVFWRITGYWLAEGSIQRCHGKNICGAVWTFAKHEDKYVADITGFFGKFNIPNFIERLGGMQRVVITCGQFARFVINHFGHGSHDKHLPEWIVRLPMACRVELLRGWWRGDGCFCNGNYRAATVSHRLADDFQLLIQSLGMSAIVFRENGKQRPVEIFGRKSGTSSGNSREVRWSACELDIDGLGARSRMKSRIKITHGWSRVKSICVRGYSGEVYDIKTESHDFVCGNAVVHNSDLTGFLMQNDPKKYLHICIPAEETDDIAPPELRGNYKDGLFWPERFTWQQLADAKLPTNLGAYGYAGQYLQSPAPPEGGTFQRVWWRFWVPADRNDLLSPSYKDVTGVYRTAKMVKLPDRFDSVVDSWDTAVEGGVTNDFYAGVKVGKLGSQKYLLSAAHEQMEYPEAKRRIRELWERPPQSSAVLIEKSSNGPAIKADLGADVPGIITIATGKLSKEERVRIYDTVPYAAQVEAGNCYLPHPTIASWVPGFIEEHAKFPKGTHDDYVDAAAQACNYLTQTKPVWPYYQPMDPLHHGPVKLTWEKGTYLHYGALYLSADLRVFLVAGYWSIGERRLYVYGALSVDQLHLRSLAQTMVEGMWLTKHSAIMVCNHDMYGDRGEKSMVRVMEEELARAVKRAGVNRYIPIAEAVDYNRLGAITLTGILFSRSQITVGSKCNEASRQISAWSIEKDRPADGYGYCEALSMVVSEVNRKIKLREKPKYIDSYRPVKEVEKRKPLSDALGYQST
jgi:predicted phage terminase large subunit-like protein